ncbi:MAG TPA: hypothetical protein VED59_03775 [Acidimicrobiales bacterium]|nr:hypothetical protein [Acidimicrobiales bacterium]
MEWAIAVAIIVVLLLSPWFSRESRDGLDWKPWGLRGTARGHDVVKVFHDSRPRHRPAA